jgi:predicted adenine nucleotide alpha hydrolase (AANH) superfamily ATPase
VTIFFYNPNIHPRKEYEIRKEENKRYAARHGVRLSLPGVRLVYRLSSKGCVLTAK